MKFIPLLKGSAAADESSLSQEYAQAEEFAPAKLGATQFFFKAGRKIYYLPLSEITRCFPRWKKSVLRPNSVMRGRRSRRRQ